MMISADLKRTPWFLLLLAISLLLLLVVAAAAGDETFYDALGRRSGSSTTHGNSTTFYDEFGRPGVS